MEHPIITIEGLVALLLRTLGLASAWIAGDGAAYICLLDTRVSQSTMQVALSNMHYSLCPHCARRDLKVRRSVAMFCCRNMQSVGDVSRDKLQGVRG